LKTINLVSCIGLILSSIATYGFLFYSLRGPSVYSTYILFGIFTAYFLSYIFSLIEIKTRFLKILIIIVCLIGLIVSGLYSILVFLNKAYYPYFLTLRLSYIDLLLFVFLFYRWTKFK